MPAQVHFLLDIFWFTQLDHLPRSGALKSKDFIVRLVFITYLLAPLAFTYAFARPYTHIGSGQQNMCHNVASSSFT